MRISKYFEFHVNVYNSRQEMGTEAGKEIEEKIIELLSVKNEIRMVFAAAPSQNEVLAYLLASDKIDWPGITAFHMDQYIGLQAGAPQSFAQFLKDRLFDKVPFKKVNLIDGNNDPVAECERYTKLISELPIDIICLGIGENGHIAFNDPPVADFQDPEVVKIVELDDICRQQQVNDGCFGHLDEVPQKALSLTIPTLMNGKYLFCVVPGATKVRAVARTLNAPISTECPATVLRTHPRCRFYFDKDSYPNANQE
jgi:glucosamine-6-phosphate deaminase